MKIRQCRNKNVEYLTSGDIWKHSYQEREVAKGVTRVTVCAGKSTIMVYNACLYYFTSSGWYFLLFIGFVPTTRFLLLWKQRTQEASYNFLTSQFKHWPIKCTAPLFLSLNTFTKLLNLSKKMETNMWKTKTNLEHISLLLILSQCQCNFYEMITKSKWAHMWKNIQTNNT